MQICRDHYSHVLSQLPDAWQLAIDSLQCKSFCVKTSTKKNITLEPFQSLVVNGVVKGVDKNVSTVEIESSESTLIMQCVQDSLHSLQVLNQMLELRFAIFQQKPLL